MKAYYDDGQCVIYHGDCREIWADLVTAAVAVLDPPFDEWNNVPWFGNETLICFTNWQNRRAVEARFGQPRAELIWHFSDGRWVSHSMPLLTHESIMVYGPTGETYVGDPASDLKPQRKGRGAIGRHSLAERTYVPRDSRALKSVITIPRNVAGEFGCWGKPLSLMTRLLAWAGKDTVADPYMGSGTVLVAAKRLGMRAVGIDREEKNCEMAVRRLAQGTLALTAGGVQ